MIHEARQELHGDVLEGQRRPVEQLQHPGVAARLHERRHRRVAEAGIGVARHGEKIRLRDGSADERMHDLDSDLGKGPAGERGNGVRGKGGPLGRHVKPAVARKSREQHVLEAQFRGAASGRNVAHGMNDPNEL